MSATGAGKQAHFRCLRCGYEYTDIYAPDRERSCPKCRSNSVRRLKKR